VNASIARAGWLLVALIGCGSLSGDVRTICDAPGMPCLVAGSKVLLAPATIENVTELSDSCDRANEWYDRYRSERQRLGIAQIAHGESAVVMASRSVDAKQRHVRLASQYQDSISQLPQAPPSDPDSLLGRLSVRSTTFDGRGHYSFGRVLHGQYFVVAAGLGWAGATVGSLPVHLDLRVNRIQTGCAV
jgi:hypothetical protein